MWGMFYSRSASWIRSHRCEPDVQQMIANLTFEDLITNEKGIAVSRALVNVVINQQIGQQISVSWRWS